VTHGLRFRNRLAALISLLLGLAAIAVTVDFAVSEFPRGLLVIGCGVLSLAFVWYGLWRARRFRLPALIASAIALIGGFILLSSAGEFWRFFADLVLVIAAAAAAERAFRVQVPLPDAPDPARAVLFFNPKSGGGKAAKFSLAGEAEARGIKAVGMNPGCDLEQMVRDEVVAGADALAMAGGDGSQATVASVAAESGLPYACIPAGTRNHFALDLGVDRNDVVGALDAFAGGGERQVDLAEVNGRAFVNNVSLGVYAEAVQRDGYRDAKMRTLLETGAGIIDSDGDGIHLTWRSPRGHEHSSGEPILVSNNQYRLGDALGFGTRPKIDDGKLGVTVFSDPAEDRRRFGRLRRPWRQWSAREFTVHSEDPVAAGIDGEACVLEPPLVFTIKPAALTVRIARTHPGASPSAAIPSGLLRGILSLVLIVAGQAPAERTRAVRAARGERRKRRD
jgi:diacylglycerol kinase family enzyme